MNVLRKNTTAKLKAKLQKLVNRSVRLRDTDENGNGNCISCGKPQHFKGSEAGHFYSVGGYPALRFDTKNIYLQCTGCNKHNHGNIHEYRKVLEKRDPENLKWLDDNRKSETLKGIAFKHWLIDEIVKFDKLVNTLEAGKNFE
jgi:hypothetical protein